MANYDRWLMSQDAWERYWGVEEEDADRYEEQYEADDDPAIVMHNGEPADESDT